jgi:RNA polymerase sigma factor (sigma-70 family)
MLIRRYLQGALGRDADEPGDAELLARFARANDPAAFELLVWRHAAMVLRVCRGVLRDHHAAEDACQATFLALARRAAAVGRRGTVAGWLYRVARRTAARAGGRPAGRGVGPVDPDRFTAPSATPRPDPDLTRLLHDELARLPEKYRSPLLLCFFEGQTYAEAARRLGWPVGTVAVRIARGKDRLRRRLTGRGVTGLAAGLPALFAADRAAAVGPSFAGATARAAVALVSGERPVPGVPPTVLALANGEVRTVTVIKLGWAAGLLAVCAAVLGGVWAAAPGGGVDAGRPAAHRAPVPADPPAKPGRLVFVREGRLASLRPDGEGLTLHSEEWRPGRDEVYPGLLRLAPDGKQVAYALVGPSDPATPGATIGEATTVHLRGLDPAAGDVDLGLKGTTWCWSPDGARLAVGSIERPGGKPATRNWAVDVTTKVRTELALPPGHLVTDWSRDGDWLLTESPHYIQPSTEMPRVTLMKRDGTAARRLNDRRQAAFGGRFAPDGRRVLFVTFDYNTRKGRIDVTDRDGTPPRPTSPDLNAQVMGACWSPDGRRIASVWRQNYANPTADQKAEFFLMLTDADGKNPVTVRKETGTMPADESAPHQLCWITLGGLDWR